MSAAVVVLFLVHVGEGSLTTTTSMTAAAEKALGANAQVSLRESDPFPSDEAAAKEADIVAEITWTLAPVAAHVHVHAKAGWVDRDIGFADADAPEDRGRTVGFVVASMVPEIEAPPPVVVFAAPPSTPAPALPDRSPTPASRPSWFLVDAYGAGATGIGTERVGLGGGLALGFRPRPFVALRFLADYRLGDVEGFGRTSAIRLGGSAGLSTAGAGPLQLGVRLELAAMRLSVARATTSTDSRTHWLPTVALLPELVASLGGQAALFLSVGPELALGTTTVTLNGEALTVLPRLRGMGELGLRVAF